MKQGKIVDDSVEEHDEDIESDEKKDQRSGSESELVEDERIEKESSPITTVISVTVSGVNVVEYMWIAVACDRVWYLLQFLKFDEEQQVMQIYFL